MARGVNKVILIGNVGSDPTINSTQSGTKVANVSIATSEQWNDKNGERQERTEWHRLVFWNRLADIVEQYVNKGDKLFVEGKLQTRKYEKDGKDFYTTEIVVSQMEMLGGSGTGEYAVSQRGDTASGAKSPPLPPSYDDQQDLPF